jgi:hypothetical protein
MKDKASFQIAGWRGRRVYYYLWVVLKNLIGWALILASPPVGLVAPGPMGLPLFLIGFAMITFPGKRGLTARVMRGRALQKNSAKTICGEIIATFALPALMVWILSIGFYAQMQRHGAALVWMIYGLSVVAAGMVVRLSVRAINYGLSFVPALRRKVRPWMRQRGINLLPPRRRQRLIRGVASTAADLDGGILEMDKTFWTAAKPWVRRIISFVLIAAIFIYIGKSTASHWGNLKGRAHTIRIGNFVVAAVMFAMFLFGVRAISWRKILSGFGHRLPLAPAVRIWSTSELARYVPGVIWQVAGRAYLALPYGVSKTVCAASQVLELIIFLLANILVALGCLVFFGFKNVHEQARIWLVAVAAMMPLLMMMLHPKIFYGGFDWVMRRMGKSPLTARIGGFELMKLLLWAIVGLLWQSLAVFLIVAGPLGLHWSKWWLVTGSYSLAWCAGFLVIASPGGLGVREVVFMEIMKFALPNYVRVQFAAGDLRAFLLFLAWLRLWTIAGEMIVFSMAYLADAAGRGRSSRAAQGAEVGAGDACG